MSRVDVSGTLSEELERLSAERKARAIAVAVHDLETDLRFSFQGDRWFHAASTIKVAVLLALFRATDEGRLRLDDSLHVRNRFFSAAGGFCLRKHSSRRGWRVTVDSLGENPFVVDINESVGNYAMAEC
jgi:beta-lactamase class A